MIKGDYEYLQGLAKYNVCAEHKRPLVVSWSASENSYVLNCGAGHYPDTLTRQLSLTQEYKAGADIPKPIKSNIEKSIRMKDKCQIAMCSHKAKYSLYNTVGDTKVWIRVCPECEKLIGHENLMRARQAKRRNRCAEGHEKM